MIRHSGCVANNTLLLMHSYLIYYDVDRWHIDNVYRAMNESKNAEKNILIVGVVSYPSSHACKTDQQRRDYHRTMKLREHFASVLSVAKNEDDAACKFNHCCAKASRLGAGLVINFLNTPHHKDKKLDYILVDYVRFPQEYYRQMIFGNINSRFNKPGRPFCSFVASLRKSNKLADGCQLIFPRHDLHAQWSDVLNLFKQKLGPVNYIHPEHNPLWFAEESIKDTYVQLRPYRHKNELEKLTFELRPPFCQIVFSAQQKNVRHMFSRVVTECCFIV